jgi:uncharacterized membrane protein YtjA (UPF0391 family)
MLEFALMFLGISAWAPSLGMYELASATRALSGVYFATYLVAALLALMFHSTLERRVLHHA